jgi:hypothetical protein
MLTFSQCHVARAPVHCPSDTIAKSGVCVETSQRRPGLLGAVAFVARPGGLTTMPQLVPFGRSNGPLPQPEWTASVYSDPSNSPNLFDQLEAVLVSRTGSVGYDRVCQAVQHSFRCVALPSN